MHTSTPSAQTPRPENPDFKSELLSLVPFLRELKQRGLKGVQLFVSDKCLGLVESLAEFYPEANWQRCAVHFYRNVFSHTPNGRVAEVARMLKAIDSATNSSHF